MGDGAHIVKGNIPNEGRRHMEEGPSIIQKKRADAGSLEKQLVLAGNTLLQTC